jgi:hypothetical protein
MSSNLYFKVVNLETYKTPLLANSKDINRST